MSMRPKHSLDRLLTPKANEHDLMGSFTPPPCDGGNTMRNLLALGLLITLSAPADAATLHHYRTRHHVVVRPGMNSSFAAVPGWAYARSAPPVQYDYSPDLSTLGGQLPCGC
jgi:hypothetical protein